MRRHRTALILSVLLTATLILTSCATTAPGEPSPWRQLTRQAVGWGVTCALGDQPFQECLFNQARGWFDSNAGGLLDEWLSHHDLGLDSEVLSALAHDLVGQLLSCSLGGQPESCLRDWAGGWASANAPQLADLIGTLLDRLIFGSPPQALRIDRFAAELSEQLPTWIATCDGGADCVRTIAKGWAQERYPERVDDAGRAAYGLARSVEK